MGDRSDGLDCVWANCGVLKIEFAVAISQIF